MSTLPPFLNVISLILPSLYIVTFIHFDKAFTTEEPTPCKPPDTLYPDVSNFPPACNIVYITSGVLFPDACLPIGTPLPSSLTIMLPCFVSVTTILLP